MKQGKESGVHRIRNGVLDLIRQEKLQFGDKLPTEEKLSELFEVSRPTLRESLKLLEDEGIIHAQHGRGRFVSAGASLSIARPITKFESASTMVRSHGYETSTEVLGFTVVAAEPDFARDLRRKTGDRLVRVERLRRTKAEPLIYSIDYIPRDLLPETLNQAEWSGSIVELLAGLGHEPIASTATVSAVTLPSDVSHLHGLEDFGPVLLIRETCFSTRGEPVLLAMDYHRGSAFKFSFLRK
ncbi:MAG: GntR family transcriptional regulator [Beijerinckiaceae bacterium]